MKLHAFLIFWFVFLSFCNKQNDKGNITLKEVASKAQKAGYNVTYQESLKVEKQDLKNITDPKLFGYSDGRLGDDTVLINKIIKSSNIKNKRISNDSFPDAETKN